MHHPARSALELFSLLYVTLHSVLASRCHEEDNCLSFPLALAQAKE